MDCLLVIEEDLPELSQVFEIQTTRSLDDAFKFAVERHPAAILIHLGTNHSESIEFCKRIRSNVRTRNIPIVVLANEDSPEAMAAAYEAGADDFFAKPLSLKEVELRVKARIRRLREMDARHPALGNLTLLPERNEVEVNGRATRLSPLEFEILRVFLKNPDRLISREELLDSIWNKAAVSQRTVDVHISALRRKLGNFSYSIEAVYGAGYILRQNETRGPDLHQT